MASPEEAPITPPSSPIVPTVADAIAQVPPEKKAVIAEMRKPTTSVDPFSRACFVFHLVSTTGISYIGLDNRHLATYMGREAWGPGKTLGQDNLQYVVSSKGYVWKPPQLIKAIYSSPHAAPNVHRILGLNDKAKLGKLDHQSITAYFGPRLAPLLLSLPGPSSMLALLQNETRRCLEIFGFILPDYLEWYDPAVEKKKAELLKKAAVPQPLVTPPSATAPWATTVRATNS